MNIIRITFFLISCFLNRGFLAKETILKCIKNVCIGDTLEKVEGQGYINTQSDGEDLYRRKSTLKKDGFEVIHMVNVNGPQKTVCSHSLLILSKSWMPKRASDLITLLTGVKVKAPAQPPRDFINIIKNSSNGDRARFTFKSDYKIDIRGPNHCPKIKLEGYPAFRPSDIRSSTKSKR